MERPDPERVRKWAELLGTGPLFAATAGLAWFAGSRLDERFGTSPWIMTCLVVLGVAGSFWKLVKTLQDLGELSGRRRPRRSSPDAPPGEFSGGRPARDDRAGETHDGSGGR